MLLQENLNTFKKW